MNTHHLITFSAMLCIPLIGAVSSLKAMEREVGTYAPLPKNLNIEVLPNGNQVITGETTGHYHISLTTTKGPRIPILKGTIRLRYVLLDDSGKLMALYAFRSPKLPGKKIPLAIEGDYPGPRENCKRTKSSTGIPGIYCDEG